MGKCLFFQRYAHAIGPAWPHGPSRSNIKLSSFFALSGRAWLYGASSSSFVSIGAWMWMWMCCARVVFFLFFLAISTGAGNVSMPVSAGAGNVTMTTAATAAMTTAASAAIMARLGGFGVKGHQPHAKKRALGPSPASRQ
jgi:hypothetical protein